MIAPLMLRMLLIWLPRWKCSRLRQSPMPFLRRYSRASITSLMNSPNLERTPPDCSQRPAPRAASFTRTPMLGLTLCCLAYLTISSSSLNFSTTGMMFLPILVARMTASMNSSSLKPLQMIGVLSSVHDRHDRQQFRLAAGFEAEAVGLADVVDLLDDVALLVDLDRVDAAVLALVVVVLDGVLKGLVKLADAVLEDVGEADQHGKLDVALAQLVDQLLQVDAFSGVLGGMDGDVAVRLTEKYPWPQFLMP